MRKADPGGWGVCQRGGVGHRICRGVTANNAAPKAGVMLAGPHPIPLSACGWRSDVGFPQALFPGVASHGDERREARERKKERRMWKNAPVPEGTPHGTRCVSLGCSPNVIHLEVHDEPLVSFIVSSRCVQNTSGGSTPT